MKLFNLIKKKLFKKHHEFTGDYLVDYYNTHDEDIRLISKHGRVEFLTTIKYIENYILLLYNNILELRCNFFGNQKTNIYEKCRSSNGRTTFN